MKSKVKFKTVIISGLTAMMFGNTFTPVMVQAVDLTKFADYGMLKTHWAKNDITMEWTKVG